MLKSRQEIRNEIRELKDRILGMKQKTDR